MTEYELVVCGCGPAGLAPLVYLEENNELDTMLDKGICLIDSLESIGKGELGNYLITANSLGKVFIEIFKNSEGNILNFLKGKQSYKKLIKYSEVAPPLAIVGDFLSDLGKYISKKVQLNPNSQLFLNSKVKKIRYKANGLFEITFRTLPPVAKEKKIIAKNVLFNLGGVQEFTIGEEISNNVPVWDSGGFLKGNYDHQYKSISDERNSNLKISIIGSSHSAFSCVTRLQNQFQHVKNFEPLINIIHRNPIKLYYQSLDEATKDFYPVDINTDICKLSGRVNRFSGLRYDSFTIAKDIMDEKYPNINLQNKNDIKQESYDSLLNESDIVILCTGYSTKLVEIIDEYDSPIEFELDRGMITINQDCNPILLNGEPFKNFYTYGLGSGLKTDLSYGGELSYRGRIDGVWVYQHEISKKILKQIHNSF